MFILIEDGDLATTTTTAAKRWRRRRIATARDESAQCRYSATTDRRPVVVVWPSILVAAGMHLVSSCCCCCCWCSLRHNSSNALSMATASSVIISIVIIIVIITLQSHKHPLQSVSVTLQTICHVMTILLIYSIVIIHFKNNSMHRTTSLLSIKSQSYLSTFIIGNNTIWNILQIWITFDLYFLITIESIK